MRQFQTTDASRASEFIDLTLFDEPRSGTERAPMPISDALESRPGYASAKRLLDITIGLVLITLVIPVCVAVAVAVKLSSPGPVLFTHERLGCGGRMIRCRKFRTMRDDGPEQLDSQLGEAFAKKYKLADDPRVTRVGRVLRRLSLDELPQLINVIDGTMSLIGPRPIVLHEAISKWGRLYPQLARVKPGISGLWQVSGRSTLDYDDRIRLDLEYVQRCGLRLDLWLLVRTVPAVLLMRGAA